MKSSIFITGFLALASSICALAAPRSHSRSHSRLHSLSKRNATEAHQSGGEQYVVLFDADDPAPPGVADVLDRVGLSADHPDIDYVFNNSAFQGFAGSMKNHCITALNAMTDVKYVEKTVQISSFNTLRRLNVPWGLERISQQAKVSGDPKTSDFNYTFDSAGSSGKGVDIYVIDSGLNIGHQAFGGRARNGFSFKKTDDINANTDEDGHGTHTAGTAAANLFGVASGANLIGIKVLGADGSGLSSDTLKGLDYLIQQHDQRKGSPGFVGSIASMSWGLESTSPSVEQSINAAIKAGVHVSVASGNQGKDACLTTPSSLGGTKGSAVSVGSVDIQDKISKFSNTGRCVDVYAPGEDIMSTWIGGSNAVNILAGTSMACPHVTGLMAYLMAKNQTLAGSPAEMKSFLASTALSQVVTTTRPISKGDLGLLVNNGIAGELGKRDFTYHQEEEIAPKMTLDRALRVPRNLVDDKMTALRY